MATLQPTATYLAEQAALQDRFTAEHAADTDASCLRFDTSIFKRSARPDVSIATEKLIDAIYASPRQDGRAAGLYVD
ncbi:hypothetical protein ACOI1H_22775, partial [Loktanella sp. DJP18]|uniref:hypothetical protein n=1 Tax=Loktanella sp. DJP18 TaxID=3409788 RepID=UPI003BB7383B